MCISQPPLYLLALSFLKVQVVLSAIFALPFTKVKGFGTVLLEIEQAQTDIRLLILSFDFQKDLSSRVQVYANKREISFFVILKLQFRHFEHNINVLL